MFVSSGVLGEASEALVSDPSRCFTRKFPHFWWKTYYPLVQYSEADHKCSDFKRTPNTTGATTECKCFAFNTTNGMCVKNNTHVARTSRN